MSGALLVMRRTDHSDDDAQDHTQEQCQHRYVQRGHHAVQVLPPAVILNERLIKKYIELLPQGGWLTGGHQRFPGRELFHGNESSPSQVNYVMTR